MTQPVRDEVGAFARRYALTRREIDVFYLLVAGISSVAELARKLGLSENTINNHFKNIYRRTGTENRTALISLFVRESLECQAQRRMFLRRPNVLLVASDGAPRMRLRRALDQPLVNLFESGGDETVLSAIAERCIDVVVTDERSDRESRLAPHILARFGARPSIFLAGELLDPTAGYGQLDVEGSPAHDALLCGVLDAFAEVRHSPNRWLRAPVDLPVELAPGLIASLRDLSFEGAFLALPSGQLDGDQAPCPGTTLSFELPLPGVADCELRAEVVWVRERDSLVRPAGVGVRFTHLTEPLRRAIEVHVRREKLTRLTHADWPIAEGRNAAHRSHPSGRPTLAPPRSATHERAATSL